MKNILIMTSTYDLTVDYLIMKYSSEIKFYRLNTNTINHYKVSLFNEGFEVLCNEWAIKSEDISAIYYRKPMLPDLNEYDPSYRDFMAKELISFIKGIANTFSGRILTKPHLLERSESKIEQLKLARQMGFKLPKYAITNNDAFASLFNKQANTGCIIKPLKTGKVDHGEFFDIYNTSLIDSDDKIDNIDKSPLFIQEFIEKDYELRITFIDNHSYPIRIDAANRVDWRLSDSKNAYSLVEVDKKLLSMCKRFLEHYELAFGAFDFIVNKGEYIFLENNPNGQWLWLEEELGLDISDKIISYLVGDE